MDTMMDFKTKRIMKDFCVVEINFKTRNSSKKNLRT